MSLLTEPVLTVGVAEQYSVRDPGELRAFVAAHPHVASFLHEAPQQIAAFFPGAPLQLEYHVDPDDGTAMILLRIRTDHAPTDALARLNGLLDAWYLDLPLAIRRDALVVL